MREQASLKFDLTFGNVLLHKLVQAYTFSPKLPEQNTNNHKEVQQITTKVSTQHTIIIIHKRDCGKSLKNHEAPMK